MDIRLFQTYAPEVPSAPPGSKSKPPDRAAETFSCALYIPEKQALFGGQHDGVIVAWKLRRDSAKDVRPSHSYTGHKGTVKHLHYMPEYKLMASASADRTIRIWDAWTFDKEKTCVQTLTGHGGTVTCVTSKGEWLFSSSTDNTVKIWKPAAGRQMFLYPWFTAMQTIDFGCWVHAVAFACVQHEGEGELYVADASGALSVYMPPNYSALLAGELDPANYFSRARKQARAHGLAVHALAVVPHEHFIFSLGFDNTMRVFDAQTGAPFFVLENRYKCRYTALAWSPQRQELLLGDEGGRVSIWNIFTERLLKEEALGKGPVLGLVVRGKLDEFFVVTRHALDVYRVVREVQFREMNAHAGPVVGILSVATSPESTEHRIFSASVDNTIRVWLPYDMSVKQVLREPSSEISALCYVDPLELLVSGNDDGTIRGWSVSSGQPWTLTGHTNTVTGLTWGALDGKHPEAVFLLSCSFDGHVGVWDVRRARDAQPHLQSLFRAHEEEVLCIAFNPLNGTIITGSNDATIRAWSEETLERAATLAGHTEAVTCLALDGNFLLSGSDDCTVRVWDTFNQQALRVLRGHEHPVRALAMLPDCGYLASCSFAGHLLIWDYPRNTLLKRLEHSMDLRCLAYSAEKKELLVGTEQSQIVVFPLAPAELDAAAHAALPEAEAPEAAPAAPSARTSARQKGRAGAAGGVRVEESAGLDMAAAGDGLMSLEAIERTMQEIQQLRGPAPAPAPSKTPPAAAARTKSPAVPPLPTGARSTSPGPS
eukprot:tig00020537_g10245.t1